METNIRELVENYSSLVFQYAIAYPPLTDILKLKEDARIELFLEIERLEKE